MRTRGVGRVACALVLVALAACGAPAADDDPPVLTWHVGPDRVDAEALAEACTRESGGRYVLEVEELPEDFDERHDQLVRRLSADDDSIDLLSLDSALTTEFSAAQLLAPIPEDLKEPLAADTFPNALLAASDGRQLVVAPWIYDPYMLWWRGSAAERAGLDVSEPITWDDLLSGAELLGTRIEIDDPDGSALGGWVNALVVGAGGTVLDGEGRFPSLGLDSEAGRSAAGVVEYFGEAGLGDGPSPQAPARFAARSGSFLLAPSSVVSDPALSDVARDLEWAAYPVLGDESVAPLTGVGLAVPLFAPRPALSYEAITCLTSDASMRQIMLDSGHSAARSTVYDYTDVQEGYPLADVTQTAVQTGAGVPSTPYWPRVRSALEDTWSPPEDVSAGTTPAASERAVRDVVAGRLP